MRSISARILAAFSLIIGFNIIIVSLSLFIGYQSSKAEWDKKVNEEAKVTLDSIFNKISYQGGINSAKVFEQALNDARERLIGIAQIDIFDSQGILLTSWANKTLDHYQPQPVNPATATPYYRGETLIGYISMYPTGFNHLEHNRQFVSRLIRMSLGGMLVSMCFSLLLAFRVAKNFTKETKNTARSLINISKGSRDIQSPLSSITEIATMNDAAISLQNRLIKEEGQRSKWYENIAHDLRTPITAMKSQFIACRDGILSLTPERWESILGELAGMETMIKDFSFLSKLESPDLKINKQSINSKAIMEYLTNSQSPHAQEKEISLAWDFQLFSFYCDFSLLTTAFSQLIRNAIQHSPPASEISISFEIESGIGVFRIINSGQLSPEAIDKIFDPLYKADNSRKKTGSGMGLTISHQIAQILGAKLYVKNLPGNRISFDMTLSTCSNAAPASNLS